MGNRFRSCDFFFNRHSSHALWILLGQRQSIIDLAAGLQNASLTPTANVAQSIYRRVVELESRAAHRELCNFELSNRFGFVPGQSQVP